MTKYIDAEKLTKNLRDIAASIEKRLHNIVEPQDKSSIDEEQLPQIILKNRVDKSFFNGELSFYDDVLTLIDSLQQEQQEEPNKSLEEEIQRYLREECSGDDEPTVSEIARHFAEWQKEQMLKDAVEGNIHLVGFYNAIFIKEPKAEILDHYNVGDKVRIVVLKSEEEG